MRKIGSPRGLKFVREVSVLFVCWFTVCIHDNLGQNQPPFDVFGTQSHIWALPFLRLLPEGVPLQEELVRGVRRGHGFLCIAA